MPKYFNDERPLLFPKVTIGVCELTADWLAALFKQQDRNSISLSFQGFEESCLGFVVHVKKTGARYEILNITEQFELAVENEQQLVEVIKHVSGVQYSEKMQATFQQIRNDIGSVIPFDGFGGQG